MDSDQQAFLDYLMGIQELEPSKARIARNRERAKELRNARDSGVRSTGRFMAAPHPLEVMATLMQRQRGMQQEQESDASEDEMMKQRREYLAQLRKRIEGQQQPQAPQQPSYGGGGGDPWGVQDMISF